MANECRVYVGNLPQFVKNHDIEDLFLKFGTIKRIDLHTKFEPAFAFIEFEDARDAEDVIYEMNDEKYEGQRLKVQYPRNSNASSSRGGSRGSNYVRGRGRGSPIQRSENRVLISGLPPTGSWQDLKDHMREAGEVLYADVYKDGTAVCEFSNSKDMRWAVKYLDDSKFKSHENETSVIRVKYERSQSRNQSPGRKSSSQNRSRSGSVRSRGNYSRSRSPQSRHRFRSRSPVHPRSRSRSPLRRSSRTNSPRRKSHVT